MTLELQRVDLHLVDQQVAERVIPPPADALDEQQRAELVASEPLSLLHVLGREGDDGAAAGERAGELLRELIDAGRYHDRGAVLAVHELATPRHRQVGLIAGIPIEDVRAGRVRAHEQTRAGRERNLADFLDAAGMDVSPVVLTHEPIDELDAALRQVTEREPDVSFLGWHEVHHRVWIVDSADHAAQIRSAARAIDAFTIVDGHHRVAAALTSVDRGSPGAPPSLLAELVTDRDLCLIGYDRLVRLEHRDQAHGVLESLSQVAEVEPLTAGLPDRPTGRFEMLVGTDTGWVSATFHDPPEGLPDALPAALLQERVLAPYLGIDDPRDDDRLEYVPGLDDLAALERAIQHGPAIAFVPRAVTADELLAVAADGATLPPKSTYVDPKPGPGVVLRLRDRSTTPTP